MDCTDIIQDLKNRVSNHNSIIDKCVGFKDYKQYKIYPGWNLYLRTANRHLLTDIRKKFRHSKVVYMIFFNEGNRRSMLVNSCHFTVGAFYWNNTEKLKSTLFDPRVFPDNGNTRSWPPLITNFYRKVCKF